MRLMILGAGGYGRTVADIAAQTGDYKIFFLDDHYKAANIMGKCADFTHYINDDTTFYPAFGDNEDRVKWINCLIEQNCLVLTIIHPTAYVSLTTQIHIGTIIMPHAVVNTDSVVKRGCIVNCGAIVDHGCVLEEGVHVCLGSIVKAENRIPRCFKVEAGAVIQNRKFPL